MRATTHNTPWLHWIADDFLTPGCLSEVKSVEHVVEQALPGRRFDSKRLVHRRYACKRVSASA